MSRRRRRHTRRRRRTRGFSTCKVVPIAAQPTNGYYSDMLKSAKYNLTHNTWTQRTGGGLGYPWMMR